MSANTGWDSLDLPGSQPVNGHIDDPVSNFQHDTDTATDAAYVEHDLDAAVLEPEHAHEGDSSKPRRNTKVLAMMGALSLAMLGAMVVVLKPAYDVLFAGGPQVSAAPPPASAALAVAAVRADAGAGTGATSDSQGAPTGAAQGAAPVGAAYVVPSPEKPAPAAQDVAPAAAAAAAPAISTQPAAMPTSSTAAAAAPATAQPAAEAPTSSAVAAVLSNASAPDHNAGAPAQRSRSDANTATPAAVVAEARTARQATPQAEAGTGTGTKAPTRKAAVARTKPPKATTVTQWAARSTPVARRPSRSTKAQPTAASATRGPREQVLGFTLLAINPHTGDFQQAWVRDAKGKLQVLSAGDRLGALQVLRIDGAKSEVVTTAGVIR